MKLAVTLLLIGMAILAYAFSIVPYKDEELFMERYMALSVGQGEEYSKLRDEMLTPKYPLQDYGGTLVAMAVVIFVATRKDWRQLKSPNTRARLLGIAFVAPLLTASAFVFDLFQSYARGEFPHWADSMGIPLMGVPVLFVVLLLWSGAHLAFLRGPYRAAPLVLAMSRKSSWWHLFISAITFALVALCVSLGLYWYAIPGFFWLYFYISLATARRANSAAEPIAPEGRAASGAPLS